MEHRKLSQYRKSFSTKLSEIQLRHSLGAREIWQAATKFERCPQWHPLDPADRRPMGGFAPAVSAEKHLPSIFPAVEQIEGLCQDTDDIGPGPEKAWRYRPQRRLYRWEFRAGKKRGDGVGKTKRGKGTKIMGLTDAFGLPIAVGATSASPCEIKLVDDTLDACFLENVPQKVIGDKTYGSDQLDKRLAKERGVELIAPHKNNRIKSTTQNGRVLRRYRKRWKVERLFAWLYHHLTSEGFGMTCSNPKTSDAIAKALVRLCGDGFIKSTFVITRLQLRHIFASSVFSVPHFGQNI